jgi:hypothetical protein
MHCSYKYDTIAANDKEKGACLDNGPGLASEDELLQVLVAMCVFGISQESLKIMKHLFNKLMTSCLPLNESKDNRIFLAKRNKSVVHFKGLGHKMDWSFVNMHRKTMA